MYRNDFDYCIERYRMKKMLSYTKSENKGQRTQSWSFLGSRLVHFSASIYNVDIASVISDARIQGKVKMMNFGGLLR